ncbi:MAG: hypothetical protein K5790_05775 [Nitrosopumilus sp.]|uniref:hypothetical protein n=1 Tax=Nitrosopumilus sp. TaxID=2024843 RepID=UPI00247E8486|nr:hypothetical protein [Nitrosopumilus sp.]MCV0392789.1 hypothetical protein [Nitrosopumilus sp.]
MKTRLLIIAGIVIFLIGISVLTYEIFGDSDLKLSSDIEISIIFYVIVPGLAISGIGVVLEFAKNEWEKK